MVKLVWFPHHCATETSKNSLWWCLGTIPVRRHAGEHQIL